MSDECISPLRRRMIEDMTVRKFTLKTQSDYIRVVKNFTIFLGRSPDTASNEDLRRFQLHLSEKRVGAPTINLTISALRFFFTVTLDRTDAVKHLTFVAEPRKIPVVLSPEEVVRFLEAAPGVKYKAALSVAYGAGLRVSPARAHDRAGWWDIARRRTMDRLPSQLSLAGESPVAAVPPPDAGHADGRARRRPPAVIRRSRPPRRQGCVQGLSRATASDRVVRLFQAAVRRARAGARLSVPLHPSGRDLQQPAHRRRRHRRHLQVQGLPDQGARPLQDHDDQAGRVHPPLPHPRLAKRVPPDQALRSARQRHQGPDHRTGA